MFGGPVFHFELVRSARRRRLFAGRFAFGLLVLVMVGLSYASQSAPNRSWYNPGELTIGEMSVLTRGIFFSVMATLAVLVLGLTPALVADAIASERQRKTLHYLLCTQLGSLEIVLGKLSARLINVAVFAVLVLPIMSLLTLLGGVSPAALVLGYAALAATTYFLAALCLLVSVVTRRPSEAIGAAYVLTAAWLVCPGALSGLEAVASAPYRELVHGLSWLFNWVGPPTPLGLAIDAPTVLGAGAEELWWDVARMMGMHAVYGTLFVVLAAWQLRPAFRRHEGRAGRPGKATRLARRWFPVRPCGDDPVFWKEAYFAVQGGGVVRTVMRAGSFVLMGAIVVGAVAGAVYAFGEFWQYGDSVETFSSYQRRRVFNAALRFGSSVLFVVWMLGLGGITAAGISSEREQDTWISLLSTPLEAQAILRGKVLGPLRATGHFAVAIVAVWVIGVVAGAVHPLGLLNALVVAAVYTAFVIALGTYLSFKLSSTWHARLWTQGLILAPQFCCYAPSAGYLLGVSLWSYSDIKDLWRLEWSMLWQNRGIIVALLLWYVGGLMAYGGVAYVLAWRVLRAFDRLAGRAHPMPQPEVVLVELTPVSDDGGSD